MFTVWRKDGKVYLELRKDQLDTDFIQSAVPVNGLGGFGIFPGAFDYAPARLIRFRRMDDKVFITWPNTNFMAPAGSPNARSDRLDDRRLKRRRREDRGRRQR